MNFFTWIYKTYVLDSEYEVIVQKNADIELLSTFDELFTKEYGLSLDNLVVLFDKRLEEQENRIQELLSFKQSIKNSKLYKIFNLLKK